MIPVSRCAPLSLVASWLLIAPSAAWAQGSDEKQVVSGDTDGRVICWDVESAQPLVTPAHTETVATALDWSRDDRHIVAGKSDGTLQIWDLPGSH